MARRAETSWKDGRGVWDPMYSECGTGRFIGIVRRIRCARFAYEEIKNFPRYWKAVLTDVSVSSDSLLGAK